MRKTSRFQYFQYISFEFDTFAVSGRSYTVVKYFSAHCSCSDIVIEVQKCPICIFFLIFIRLGSNSTAYQHLCFLLTKNQYAFDHNPSFYTIVCMC